MPRIRASTSASSGFETRSVLFSRMTSANAIWFLASGASFRRSLSHLASATVTTASSRAFFVYEEVQKNARLDAGVTVADAKWLSDRLKDAPEAKNQIAFADVIVLNKTDLVSKAELAEVE